MLRQVCTLSKGLGIRFSFDLYSIYIRHKTNVNVTTKEDEKERKGAHIKMLPLYKQTMRFVADPYKRMKKQAVVGAAMALVLLFLFFIAMSTTNQDNSIVTPPTPKVQQPRMPAAAKDVVDPLAPPVYADGDAADKKNELLREEPDGAGGGAEGVGRWKKADGEDGDAAAVAHDENEGSKMPWFVRLILPLVAGYCFGFLGSVPIAGPTSAMVLKLGIQGKYQAALTIAFGGAISEAVRILSLQRDFLASGLQCSQMCSSVFARFL